MYMYVLVVQLYRARWRAPRLLNSVSSLAITALGFFTAMYLLTVMLGCDMTAAYKLSSAFGMADTTGTASHVEAADV